MRLFVHDDFGNFVMNNKADGDIRAKEAYNELVSKDPQLAKVADTMGMEDIYYRAFGSFLARPIPCDDFPKSPPEIGRIISKYDGNYGWIDPNLTISMRSDDSYKVEFLIQDTKTHMIIYPDNPEKSKYGYDWEGLCSELEPWVRDIINLSANIIYKYGADKYNFNEIRVHTPICAAKRKPKEGVVPDGTKTLLGVSNYRYLVPRYDYPEEIEEVSNYCLHWAIGF